MRRFNAPLYAASLLLAACVFRTVSVRPLDARAGTAVTARARVHLSDGSTVLFPAGFVVNGGALRGTGIRYALDIGRADKIASVPLDSVLGVESYEGHTSVAPSVAVTLLVTAGTVVGGALLAIAIFGSCPTFYADSGGRLSLEAEGFSYSIASLLEARDVDRLKAQPGPDGVLRLEVRNEALETHFINQLQVLDVRRSPDEVVAPDPGGRPIALRGLSELREVRDGSGTDQTTTVKASDEVATHSSPAMLGAASLTQAHDYLEFDVPVPAGADSVALLLRARNSLLTTVLFYDVILARQGGRAVSWVGKDLQEIGPVAELAQWASAELGMHVLIPGEKKGGWREVSRLADPGPIAWKDVVIMIPASRGPRQRVRLESAIDGWRVDRIAVAGGWRRPAAVLVDPDSVVGRDGAPDSRALAAVSRPDASYLETHPGDRFTVTFPVGPVAPGEARTLLLVAQGYYSEWIRPKWLVEHSVPVEFVPGRPALVEALHRWEHDQSSLEHRFYSTRIPVR